MVAMQQLKVSVVVKNVGAFEIPMGTPVHVELDKDGVITPLLDTQTDTLLLPGQFEILGLDIPLPNDIATRYDAGSATGRRINASMVSPGEGKDGRASGAGDAARAAGTACIVQRQAQRNSGVRARGRCMVEEPLPWGG